VLRNGRIHWIEAQTGWSIKKFVRAARRYCTVTIQAGGQTLTAAEPPPPHLAEALAKFTTSTTSTIIDTRIRRWATCPSRVRARSRQITNPWRCAIN
jgi:hypothetical protein